MVSLRGSWQFLVRTGLFVSIAFVSATTSFAGTPACSSNKVLNPFQPMPMNNAQVLKWKLTTPNQFLARGFVEGRLVKVLPDQTGHAHFIIQIGQRANEVLEVIYNEEFGKLPDLRPGSIVVACGDYITSTAMSGSLKPSPAGAIIHWVHQATGPNHSSGFVMIDNVVYGNLPGRGGR